MRRTSSIGIAVYLGLGAALAAGAAACSGDANQVAPVSLDSVAPPLSVVATAAASTTAIPVTAASAASSTTATSTSAPTADTSAAPITTVGGLTGPMFSDDLGVKVDTAPGVNTRGDTRRLLDEGVFVHIAWEPDPTDASVFTVQPDDIPILEAYAMANAVYYRAAMGQTTTDDPLFDALMLNGGDGFAAAFDRRRNEGVVLSVGSGVLLRPYVLGDNRTETSAIIFDCYLHDEQEVAISGGQPNLSPFRQEGQFAVMTKIDGAWKVQRAGLEPGACL
jgi:hypothetical protein